MLNRMNDYFIKYLLGKPQNKGIALNFINAALSDSYNRFADIAYVDKDEDPTFEDEKQSRLDLKGVLDDGSIIDIEMQVAYYANMAERSLYYWARMYGDQLKEGEKYVALKPCIALNLLDFAYLAEPSWVNKYKVINVVSNNPLTEHLYIAFLELPKLIEELKVQKKAIKDMSALELWGAYFCRLVDDKDLEAIPMLDMALVAEKYFTADAQMRRKYEQREAFLRDQLSLQGDLKNARAAQAKAEATVKLINTLYTKLLEQNRLEDMKRAMRDDKYRERLMQELLPGRD